MWAVNVKAPMRMIRLALPHLKASGAGRVINIASLSGKRVPGADAGYSMSKFAVMALSRLVGSPNGKRMTEAIGTVTALWRYPVASMCGETVESVEIDTGGVIGDRGWGVYATGASEAGFAARGRKWRNLVQVQARFIEPPQIGADCPPVAVHLPDGTVLRSGAPDVEVRLSALLGHDVVLRRVGRAAAADGSRFAQSYEHAPLHI